MSIFRRFVFAPAGETRTQWAIAGLRVFFGLALALGHGTNKFPVKASWVETVGNLGFPFPMAFAWGATLSELVGGFMLAAGLLTRVASTFILATMTVAAFMANAGVWKKAELAFIFGVVALFFLVYGGGRKSLDGLLSR